MDLNRRLMLFVSLSALVLGGWLLINMFFGPKPPNPANNGADVAENNDDGEEPAVDGGEPAVDIGEEPPEVVEDPQLVAADKELPTEQHYVAIGSIDPESGYRFLATFTTQGGAVAQIELSDPKFQELESPSGYLGFLALSNVAKGVQINVNLQGSGTPADVAGLRKGDVLRTFNGEEIVDVEDFLKRLKQTRPSQTLKLGVIKEGVEKTTEVTVNLVRAPVAVIRPEIPSQTQAEGDEGLTDSTPIVHSFRSTLRRKIKNEKGKLTNVQLDSLLNGQWELTSPSSLTEDALAAATEVEFQRTLTAKEQEKLGLKNSFTIIKRYQISQRPKEAAEVSANAIESLGYHLTLDLEVINNGDTAESIGYQIHGANGLPTEGWWYAYKIGHGWGAAGIRDVLRKTEGLGADQWTASMVFHSTLKKNFDDNDLFTDVAKTPENSTVHYAGVDSRYFAAVLAPGTIEKYEPVRYQSGRAMALSEVSKEEKLKYKLTNVSFLLNSFEEEIEPGKDAAFKQSFVIFAGPKDPQLMNDYGMGEFIYYGWFGIVSRPLLGILHILYYVTWNYGLAIILLTLVVRACMLPISRKATQNALVMQQMAPEMKAINEKHKNDMEKRGEALRALYKKYNHNPMSGCLLMFLQLPIFMALYRGLAADIELRGAALIPGLNWCSNMAAPDQLLFWGTWPEWFLAYTGWLGPYLNVLPLVTVVLFILQQQIMTPPATDEQTAQTQSMTKYMMIMVAFMFFKVPSGLCIYFITSSVWGLIERKLLPKPKLPPGAAMVASDDPKDINPDKGGAAKKFRDKKRNKKK